MTLILSLQSPDFVVQLSDRRLTVGTRAFTDESDKTAVVQTVDAMLVMGFSGLARTKLSRNELDDLAFRFVTMIQESGPPDYQWPSMQWRFAQALTEYFQNDRRISALDPGDRRTSFHFAGYQGPMATPVATFVTNFQDRESGTEAAEAWDAFVPYTRESDTVWIEPLGMFHRIGRKDIEPLAQLALSGRPPKAIVGKGVELMRGWAEQKWAKGTIGKQITSIILRRGSDTPECGYHTDIATTAQYYPKQVVAWPDGFVTGGLTLQSSDGKPVAYPKAQRNEQCPCGSGIKYKRCHGKP